MKLSERLTAIADMVTPGNVMADIGTDHGFLPIELVRNGKYNRAIAIDVVNGPLERAMEHIGENDLGDKIECRLSDGFEKLDVDEADTVVVAGMGGDLISNILDKKPRIAKELVLSPHTHAEIVRHKLSDQGYKITDERMIIDAGKYYVIIKAVRSNEVQKMSAVEEFFGSVLLKNKDEVLKSYVNKEIEKFREIPQRNDYMELLNIASEIINN